jgi:hypothetical protein
MADLEILVTVKPMSLLQLNAHTHQLLMSEIPRNSRKLTRGIARSQRDTFRP